MGKNYTDVRKIEKIEKIEKIVFFFIWPQPNIKESHVFAWIFEKQDCLYLQSSK